VTKLGVIAQTPNLSVSLRRLLAAALGKAREVRVFNTICHATTIRQQEAVEIAKKVNCMVVAGGYNSGNTQRLVSICKEAQPATYHIEEAKELKPRWFLGKGGSASPQALRPLLGLLKRSKRS